VTENQKKSRKSSGTIESSPEGEVWVILIKGYFEENLGCKLQDLVDALIQKQCTEFIIDFSQCFVVNSPGVAKMGDLALTITQDIQGRLFLTGLDNLKARVFECAGVTLDAEIATTIEQALGLLVSHS